MSRDKGTGLAYYAGDPSEPGQRLVYNGWGWHIATIIRQAGKWLVVFHQCGGCHEVLPPFATFTQDGADDIVFQQVRRAPTMLDRNVEPDTGWGKRIPSPIPGPWDDRETNEREDT